MNDSEWSDIATRLSVAIDGNRCLPAYFRLLIRTNFASHIRYAPLCSRTQYLPGNLVESASREVSGLASQNRTSHRLQSPSSFSCASCDLR